VAERAQAQYAVRDEEDEPRLEAGVWTLQFWVTQNFTLGSFQRSALSAKRHFSPRSALRAGLSLTADFREARPREALGDSSEEDAGNERTAEHDQQRVSLSAQYVRYAFVE
jgi:hypothetical protein